MQIAKRHRIAAWDRWHNPNWIGDWQSHAWTSVATPTGPSLVVNPISPAVVQPQTVVVRAGMSDGSRWAYSATRDGKRKTGTIRVRDTDLFEGDKQVGHVRVKSGTSGRDEMILSLTGADSLNGEAVLGKVGSNPPVWAGSLSNGNGAAWKFELRRLLDQ